MSKFNQRQKGVKGQIPTALPAMPNPDVIRVVQFQFFDNGPKPGKGKSEHSIKLEVYCEEKFVIKKPYWVRTVQLVAPNVVREWAETQHQRAKITADAVAFYQQAETLCEVVMARGDVQWAKLGHIMDRRSHTIYPGQFIMCWRELTGAMQCHVCLDGNMDVSTDRFIHDQYSFASKPGETGRRKAYAFYDPTSLYYQTKAVEEWVRSNGATGTVDEIRAAMIEAAMQGRNWRAPGPDTNGQTALSSDFDGLLCR